MSWYRGRLTTSKRSLMDWMAESKKDYSFRVRNKDKADAREQKVYVYQAYKEFCFENGYKPLSSVQFTKELERLDTTPKIEDKTAKIKGKAYKAYINLELKPTLTIEE